MSRNALNQESSPYLLQHRHNPVWWQPWGESAFGAAAAEDKPIFLSIGYSTCYWCHVMERDSFEAGDVAAVLNAEFISIKVDREERPDIDQVYMEAVVSLGGRGGWPLTVFLTPELKPFWGATFLPREQLLQVLRRISDLWKNDRVRLTNAAAELSSHISRPAEPINGNPVLDERALEAAFKWYQQNFDAACGGFGAAPKFPPPLQLSLLLRLGRRLSSPARKQNARAMVDLTLKGMALGGMYDQLGGGFHRYATDSEWLIPHFEKMLYDNALLAWTYLEAWQESGDRFFLETAKETLAYVTGGLKCAGGGFFCAEDAGEPGREGEYYVWSKEELKKELAPAEFDLFLKYHPLTSEGNLEGGKNVLGSASLELWRERQSAEYRALRAKLLELRSLREAPHRDEKIIAAWNGLAISALAKAYQATGEANFLEQARECAAFLKGKLFGASGLLHSICAGRAGGEGFLDDYACLIEALLNLYESDFDAQWLKWAVSLQALQDQRLWDPSGNAYVYSAAPEIIARRRDFADSATPAGNPVSLGNLQRLYLLLGGEDYKQKTDVLFRTSAKQVMAYPSAFPKLLQALDFELDGAAQIAVVFPPGGLEPAREFLSCIWRGFYPNKVLVCGGGQEPGFPPLLCGKRAIDESAAVYVCRDGICLAPFSGLDELRRELDRSTPL